MAEYYIYRGNEDRWLFPLYDEGGNPIVFASLTAPQGITIECYVNDKLQGSWGKNTAGTYGLINAGTQANECFVNPTAAQTASWPKGQLTCRVIINLTDTLTPPPVFSPTRDFVQWKDLGFVLDFK